MIFRNMEALGIDDVHKVLKVGDTASDIKEGKHAGVWSAGVVIGSSEMGLSEEEYQALSPEEQEAKCKETEEKFYAAGAEEGAYPYPQKKHGLFTYFLLKALQNNPEITYGALFDYVSANVEHVSEELYGREQKPEVYSSEWDGEAWRDFTL